MGLKAAIQALKKAEKLKEKVQSSKDLLNDNEAWVCQQQLQRIYQQVLILDLEYALDRKVEQELWNHGFKNYIGTLQNLAKDKKNPKRPESQAMLSWCLEAASGFYLTLLQEICTAFDLDLPFRRKGAVYGNSKILRAVEHLSQPHKSSCYYICQHCLVHLGDIARYRSQSRQAEAFYRHAVQLAPNSGQPYNQLALLEASRGDKLSTVFHYVRSVEVRHPFPAAATNLTRTLNKNAEEQLNVEGRAKLSTSEYISVFLKFHGLLHGGIDFVLAEKYVKILTTTLTAHVATESLTSWKFVQMLAINLFALHHAGGCLEPETPILSLCNDQLTKDERQARQLILNLMAGSLSAFLLPVYTLKEGDALLEYYALPAIKLTLDWIRLEPKVLSESAFSSRLQIWPSLCKLLNGLQSALADLPEKYESIPLPEDRDLQGFLPLEKAFSNLRFSAQDWALDTAYMNKLRAIRLLEFGSWLAKNEDYRLIANRSTDSELMSFEAIAGLQVPPPDLIRELEELSLGKVPSLPSPAPSECSSWSSSMTGASTPDHCSITAVPAQSPPSAPLCEASLERRTGILKPQGSLEKSREKDKENADGGTWITVGNSAPKRGRQNVAMQAIMRKTVMLSDQQESPRALESKQVTFKTPSPSNSPSSSQGTDDAIEVKVPIAQPWPQPVAAPKQQPLLQQLQQQSLSPQLRQQLPQAMPQMPPLPSEPSQPVPYNHLPAPNPVSPPSAPGSQIPPQLAQPPSQSLPSQVSEPTLLQALQKSHMKLQQNTLYKPPSALPSTPAQPQRPMVPFVSKGLPPSQQNSLFAAFNANQIPLYPNQPVNGVQNNSAQQAQQQRHLFGMKYNQPAYPAWQEEAPPPLPPSSWWNADRQSSIQDDLTQPSQLNSPSLSLSYYGLLQQQQQQQQQQKQEQQQQQQQSVQNRQNNQGRVHPKPTDLVADIFAGGPWNGHDASSVPVNMLQGLGSLNAPHHSQFASHLTSGGSFQSGHVPSHHSMFTGSRSIDNEVKNMVISETSHSDPNCTMFSSAPNTYSLFSSSTWAGNGLPRAADVGGSSCRSGVTNVLNGANGGSTLTLGQQSLWSGPGPSPLERLLEQQKQLREGPTPKGGT